MRKKLLIFPCNGNGQEAISCLGNNYKLIGFIDDDIKKQGKVFYGHKIFSRQALKKYKNVLVLAVFGRPENYLLREKVIESLKIPMSRFATVIHPKAEISRYAHIGKNVLIMANVVLTGNTVIGNHVCVLPNTVLHHDSEVNDYSMIGSNVIVAGFSKIGKNCYIGSGSNIINNVKIGDYSLIGMGANVISNVGRLKVAVGNPAKIIKEIKL